MFGGAWSIDQMLPRNFAAGTALARKTTADTQFKHRFFRLLGCSTREPHDAYQAMSKRPKYER
jgi:hypothetical protein